MKSGPINQVKPPLLGDRFHLLPLVFSKLGNLFIVVCYAANCTGRVEPLTQSNHSAKESNVLILC